MRHYFGGSPYVCAPLLVCCLFTRLENTLSWGLTGSLSADYTLNILRLPQVTTQTQVTQSLLFRHSLGS